MITQYKRRTEYMLTACAAKRFLFGFDSDNSQHRPNDAYVHNFFLYRVISPNKPRISFVCIQIDCDFCKQSSRLRFKSTHLRVIFRYFCA